MSLIFYAVLLFAILFLGAILSLFPKPLKIFFAIVLFVLLINAWGSLEHSSMSNGLGTALFKLPLLAGAFIGLILFELSKFLIRGIKGAPKNDSTKTKLKEGKSKQPE